jgi:uncharacterized surface protein with fasciclin (FAS1) repeats
VAATSEEEAEIHCPHARGDAVCVDASFDREAPVNEQGEDGIAMLCAENAADIGASLPEIENWELYVSNACLSNGLFQETPEECEAVIVACTDELGTPDSFDADEYTANCVEDPYVAACTAPASEYYECRVAATALTVDLFSALDLSALTCADAGDFDLLGPVFEDFFAADYPEECSEAAVVCLETEPLPNLVELAVGTEGFTTLVAAVEAAGAVELLTSEGPFTVFAPTDAAFDALPEGTLDDLLTDAAEGGTLLLDILSLHVAAGQVYSGDLSDGLTVTTINEQELIIGVTDGLVTVDAGGSVANVLIPDNQASNGVVHVIDAVLLPAAE